MRRILSFSMAAFTSLAAAVEADVVPFEGRVLDLNSAPVHGAEVALYDLDDPGSRVTATTDENGSFSLSPNGLALPRSNALGQNYPNPFNPSTLIPFQISAGGRVRLDVFNVLGQRVVTLIDEARPAGLHKAQWDGTDAAGRAVGAGVYIYRLSAGRWQEARKLLLVDGQAGRPGRGGGPTGSRGEEAARYGVEISGEEIVPAAFTWSPGTGPLAAQVTRANDARALDREDPAMAAGPFSGTSLASIVEVVSAYGIRPRHTGKEKETFR